MQTPSRRSWQIGLAAAALAAALALGAAAWRGMALQIFSGPPISQGETPVSLSIGGEPLTIPANRLRFAEQRRAGDYGRVELELKWPKMQALDPGDPALMTTARDGQLVFITIEPRETDLDTADRIATIYQKFLVPDDNTSPTDQSAPAKTSGPGPTVASSPALGPVPNGLVRRRFLDTSAYAGEDLYFEPGSVHPFAARCFPPDKGKPPQTCLRDLRLGRHLLATIRFPIAALVDWREFRDRVDQIIAEMTEAKG